MEKLVGENVYLRTITEEDTDLIINWRNSEAVRPYFIYQKPFTREGHLNWLKNMIFSGKGYQFIVCMKEDDKPIGSTFLRDHDKEHNKIEYGMFLGSDDIKGKGIGREICRLTWDFAFDKLDVHKIFSRILADNMASRRSCERAGMKEEAYLKDDVRINGEYRDLVWLSVINPNHSE